MCGPAGNSSGFSENEAFAPCLRRLRGFKRALPGAITHTQSTLAQDPAFKAVVEEYAADQSLFFEEYTSAWIKLQENGVAERLRDEL